MPNPERRFIAVLGWLLSSFALVPPAVVADELSSTQQTYSVASLQGDYALVGSYGANVARLLGTYHADGQGNLAGSAKVNLPGAAMQRVVVSLTMEGTYAIDEDGTGVVYVTVTFPDGRTSNVTLDLLITKSVVIHSLNIATETMTAQREPSPVVDGQFVTHVSTRRPDRVHDRGPF